MHPRWKSASLAVARIYQFAKTLRSYVSNPQARRFAELRQESTELMLRILSSIALAIVPALAIIVFICLLSSRVDIAVVTNSIRMDVESGAVDYPTDWNMRTGAIDWAALHCSGNSHVWRK